MLNKCFLCLATENIILYRISGPNSNKCSVNKSHLLFFFNLMLFLVVVPVVFKSLLESYFSTSFTHTHKYNSILYGCCCSVFKSLCVAIYVSHLPNRTTTTTTTNKKRRKENRTTHSHLLSGDLLFLCLLLLMMLCICFSFIFFYFLLMYVVGLI